MIVEPTRLDPTSFLVSAMVNSKPCRLQYSTALSTEGKSTSCKVSCSWQTLLQPVRGLVHFEASRVGLMSHFRRGFPCWQIDTACPSTLTSVAPPTRAVLSDNILVNESDMLFIRKKDCSRNIEVKTAQGRCSSAASSHLHRQVALSVAWVVRDYPEVDF